MIFWSLKNRSKVDYDCKKVKKERQHVWSIQEVRCPEEGRDFGYTNEY